MDFSNNIDKEIIFQNNEITVSKNGFKINNQVYAINAVLSVKSVSTTENNKIIWYIFLGIGLLLIADPVSLINILSLLGKDFENNGLFNKISIRIVGSILAIVGLILSFKIKSNKTYHIFISTSAGEEKVYSTSDKEMVDTIINAINQVIILRG